MEYLERDVAVFWDIAPRYLDRGTAPATFDEIVKILEPYGPIMLFKGYVDKAQITVAKEKTALDALATSGVTVVLCPKNCKKEILGHQITHDAVLHVASREKPLTVVFVVGDRSYSYLALQLIARGHHVVVLVRRNGVLVEKSAAHSWPTDENNLPPVPSSKKRPKKWKQSKRPQKRQKTK